MSGMSWKSGMRLRDQVDRLKDELDNWSESAGSQNRWDPSCR